jgi:hypothetical protein
MASSFGYNGPQKIIFPFTEKTRHIYQQYEKRSIHDFRLKPGALHPVANTTIKSLT